MDSHLQARGRWFRFSLRTFLVLLTMFSLWLGIQVSSARRQAKAVAAIEQMGGRVLYDFQYSKAVLDGSAEPHLPRWLWPVFGKGRVECVDFTLVPVNDHDLRDLPEQLEAFPSFRLLCLAGTHIGDATLARMNELRNFTILNVDGTRVTDEGLEHILNMPQLESLSIVFADRVSEVGLRRLADHPRLGRVVWNTRKNASEDEWRAYNRLVDVLRSRGGPGF